MTPPVVAELPRSRAGAGRSRIGPTRSHHPHTAFVLSGGASLGAIQAGMLHALYEREIVPDVLIGTSAGALNAAFVASRPQTVQSAEDLAAVWRGLRREQIFPVSPRAMLAGLRGTRDHLASDEGLSDLIARHLEMSRLEDARVPLHLVAYDLLAGEEVRLSSGSARQAVLASAAIPAILPGVEWRGRLLVDGGVIDNTPISHAIELGSERIYVLTTHTTTRGMGAAPANVVDAAIHAINLLVGHRLAEDLLRYRGDAEIVVLPPGNAAGVQPSDFSHADDLIREAKSTSRRFLQIANLAGQPS